MNFQQLFADERGVSPVIGVILMVAITVILAAVIGTFVLGLGSQLQSTAPQASFGFETADGADQVTVTHESGDTISSSSLSLSSTVTFNDSNSAGTFSPTKSAAWGTISGSPNSDVSAGSSVTITADGTSTFGGETVRVIYSSPESDSSSTLSKFEVPS